MKKKKISSSGIDIVDFCQKKILYYENIIQKTAKSANRYKMFDVYGASELNVCIKQLESVYHTIQVLKASIEFKTIDSNDIMTNIQEINEQLFDIFKKFGTDQLEDLLQVSLGYEYIQQVTG